MPEITFEGHEPAIRTIEPGPLDLLHFKDAVKSLALADIEYQNWDGPFYNPSQRALVDLCEKFDIDYTYKKDRVAFASALIKLI
jgi:hypothetical protein